VYHYRPADKITEGVETCLPFTVGHSDQFGYVSGYVKSLRQVGEWTDAELMEVQILVIRAIMKRNEAGDSPGNT
jgi:hypothetical protein